MIKWRHRGVWVKGKPELSVERMKEKARALKAAEALYRAKKAAEASQVTVDPTVILAAEDKL